MISKVTLLIGLTPFIFLYTIVKNSILESNIRIVEKIYSIYSEKLIRKLHLNSENIKINLRTTLCREDNSTTTESTLFTYEGMKNNKIIYVPSEYNVRIGNNILALKIRVLFDLSCKMYDHYVSERENINDTVYCDVLRKYIFSFFYILKHMISLLFI